ncbi:MAG: hypothetical protein NZM26_02920 [Patescibacteria group bacterium]|nr:hypothetical protein [Patescibacteria group bacterium]
MGDSENGTIAINLAIGMENYLTQYMRDVEEFLKIGNEWQEHRN